MTTHNSKLKSLCLMGSVLATAISLPQLATAAANKVVMADQGFLWKESARQNYYVQDQGSRMMPLSWFRALKQVNGAPFLEENLSRYGYLPNPKSKDKLPVGFTTGEMDGKKFVGLTCSACHTRQIDVGNTSYRLDGGPAFIDFQTFMADIDKAMEKVLNDSDTFKAFAKDVLGENQSDTQTAALRTELNDWFVPYHTLVKGSFTPEANWGPVRLDAVSMIFNRVTGLDIGPAPTYMIPENIKPAIAPVRYPFVWNASKQDFIQWPGFAPNGNDLFALSRNLGEVLGVFGYFHPEKDDRHLLKVNYIGKNSGNFKGLHELEQDIKRIGPPKWPWKLDKKLVAEGKKVFYKKDPNEENLSCADCHGIKASKRRLPFKTWVNRVMDVGTDTLQLGLLGSEIKTGVLEGSHVLPGQPPLKPVDLAFTTLNNTVNGSILQHYLGFELTEDKQKAHDLLHKIRSDIKAEAQKLGLPDATSLLKKELYEKLNETLQPANLGKGYESRVMQGIWAVAPYLHNGSVPTLEALLTPSEQRPAEFQVGPEYDIKKVGLAEKQTKFNFTYKTTDCKDLKSGNSRCGHEYGTTFSDAEKKALLEYLKQL